MPLGPKYPVAMNRPAVVVLGSPSARMRRRLVAAAERVPGACIVFSGWEGEAEEMRSLWRGSPDVELVLEPTAATTAENAARTLPLLLERGVTEAVIVCAPLHLPRAAWIFRRVYERHGVGVRFAVARAAPTPGAVVWELAALTVARRQMQAARAELKSKWAGPHGRPSAPLQVEGWRAPPADR
jgi:uncharacterized SAM-binding protein YcdF (DUF218 family)